jgi:hypothetical protein
MGGFLCGDISGVLVTEEITLIFYLHDALCTVIDKKDNKKF